MNFFQKASNGWNIAKNSYKVIGNQRSLLLFPMLSGISLLLILILVAIGSFGLFPEWLASIKDENSAVIYLLIFLYYVINYFVIVFFNTALTYCVSEYLDGREVSIKAGISFSVSRLGFIFSWAVFAATVGTILQVIQENLGTVGKIITGLVGVVFNVASFFIIPVMAFENLGPIDAFKRSAGIIREKWGNAIGASFNFGFAQLIAIIFIGIVAWLLGVAIHVFVGVAFALIAGLLLITVISAAKVIFVTALYKNVSGDPVAAYEENFVNNLFITK